MGLKEAYIEKHEAQLRECDAEIERIEAKAARARAEVKILYFEQLQSLYMKRDKARSQVEALKTAGVDAWESLKDGIENAWEDLNDGMKGAVQKLRS